MTSQFISRVIAPFLLALLAGCSNTVVTPTTHYYLLDPLPKLKTGTANAENPTRIQLDNIAVADYLNHPNLVMRTANQELLFANYHIWADNLSKSIKRVLRQSIENNRDNLIVQNSCVDCPRLGVSITHFYPTESGRVLLAGQFQITSNGRDTTTQDFGFSRELNRPGYSESVKVMNILLDDLGVMIAQVLDKAGKQ